MTDYERSFSELVRHVPFIRDDEVSKTKRFAVGLRPEIRTIVSSTAHTQYGQVVEATVRVERILSFNLITLLFFFFFCEMDNIIVVTSYLLILYLSF